MFDTYIKQLTSKTLSVLPATFTTFEFYVKSLTSKTDGIPT